MRDLERERLRVREMELGVRDGMRLGVRDGMTETGETWSERRNERLRVRDGMKD